MKTQIEQEPVACIYNGNQYMRHEFMDDKIPEGAIPLYAAPVDATRLETEYQAATLRIDNDLMVIAVLTIARDAYAKCADDYANDADSMAAAHKVEREALTAERDALKADIRQMSADLAAIEKMRQEKDARMYAEKSALKDAARLALDALENLHGIDTETEPVTIWVDEEIAALISALKASL